MLGISILVFCATIATQVWGQGGVNRRQPHVCTIRFGQPACTPCFRNCDSAFASERLCTDACTIPGSISTPDIRIVRLGRDPCRPNPCARNERCMRVNIPCNGPRCPRVFRCIPAAPVNPCRPNPCSPLEECRVNQCVRAPCTPAFSCVTPVPVNPCRPNPCSPLEECRVNQCVRAPCIPAFSCITPVPVNPCRPNPCSPVEECVVNQCFRAPCNPPFSCVFRVPVNPCRPNPCSPVEECVVNQCFRAPCNPAFSCVVRDRSDPCSPNPCFRGEQCSAVVRDCPGGQCPLPLRPYTCEPRNPTRWVCGRRSGRCRDCPMDRCPLRTLYTTRLECEDNCTARRRNRNRGNDRAVVNYNCNGNHQCAVCGTRTTPPCQGTIYRSDRCDGRC